MTLTFIHFSTIFIKATNRFQNQIIEQPNQELTSIDREGKEKLITS